jgi:hypothetical protein
VIDPALTKSVPVEDGLGVMDGLPFTGQRRKLKSGIGWLRVRMDTRFDWIK